MNKAFTIMIVVIVFLSIGISFAIYDYINNHPCIEYEEICQEEYIYTTYNAALKMPMTQIGYRDIDCNKEYDRVIKRCINRK